MTTIKIGDMFYKKCTCCKYTMLISYFYKKKDSPDGYSTKCKMCFSDYHIKNREKNNKKSMEYYFANRTERDRYNKEYRKSHPNVGRDSQKRQRNKLGYREKQREYYMAWKAIPENRIRVNLTNRVHASLKRYNKGYVNTSLWCEVGCDKATLKKHLEQQFTDGMSWENYGKWHVDHIKPWASFDILDEQQRKECSHYTNLQPLWAEDNLRKSDKLDWTKE